MCFFSFSFSSPSLSLSPPPSARLAVIRLLDGQAFTHLLSCPREAWRRGGRTGLAGRAAARLLGGPLSVRHKVPRSGGRRAGGSQFPGFPWVRGEAFRRAGRRLARGEVGDGEQVQGPFRDMHQKNTALSSVLEASVTLGEEMLFFFFFLASEDRGKG